MTMHRDVRAALQKLGLPTDGDVIENSELQRAYRQLALKWHPDRHPQHLKGQAEARMKEINSSHQIVREWLHNGANEGPGRPQTEPASHEASAGESEWEPETTWEQEPDWEPGFASEREPDWEPESDSDRTSAGYTNQEAPPEHRRSGAREQFRSGNKNQAAATARQEGVAAQSGSSAAPTLEIPAQRIGLLSALVFFCGMLGMGLSAIGTVVQLATGIEGSFVAMLALMPCVAGLTLGRRVRRRDLDGRSSDLLVAGKVCSYISGLAGFTMGVAFFFQWQHSAVFLAIAGPSLILVFAAYLVLRQIGNGSVWAGARKSLAAIVKAAVIVMFLSLTLVLPDRVGRKLARWLAGVFEGDSDRVTSDRRRH